MKYDIRTGQKESIETVLFDERNEIKVKKESKSIFIYDREVDTEVIIEFKDIDNLIKALEFIKRECNLIPVKRNSGFIGDLY